MAKAWLDRIRNSLGRLLAEGAKKISVDPRSEEAELAENVKSFADSQPVEFEDQPIDLPEEDKFGFDPLAKAIADGIANMRAPHGTVLAVNGPWGSGKSSAINLVRHHLRSETENGNLEIVDFKCWWFRGEEALLLAFLHVLCSAMKSAEGDQIKRVITELGSQLLIKASPLVGSVLNVPHPAVESLITEMGKVVGKLLSQDETVEKLHEKLFEELRQSSKRYVVVIDDIDRLSPDDALLIFRLVKSVGALPKVFYLLAYDRHLAEEIVTKRYPSEGPHYLEKIVQASFNLPAPTNLKEEFLRRLYEIIGEQEFEDKSYFDRLFDRLIAPEIITPRHILRILNPLQVTWAAVRGEVDPADFLCLETLRMQRPKVYDALGQNKIRLTQGSNRLYADPSSEQYDKIFLASEPEESERERLRRGLKRLFPLLQLGWRGSGSGMSNSSEMDKKRRVCSPKHFDTYFRFTLSNAALSRSEIDRLIDRSGDPGFIQQEFRQAASARRVALLLEALITHAGKVPEKNIRSLLITIYSVADDLVEQRERELEARSYGTIMEDLRELHQELTSRYNSLEDKSDVLLAVCQGAALGCLAFFAQLALDESNGASLTTREHANTLRELSARRIREAADDGSLIDCPLLYLVLIWWRKITDRETEVRSWLTQVMREDGGAVVRLARAFTGVIPSGELQDQEGGPRPSERVRRGHLERVVDLDEFRGHVERALEGGPLEPEDREALQVFLNWNARQRSETGSTDSEHAS